MDILWQKPCFPEVVHFFPSNQSIDSAYGRRFVFVLAILATVVKSLPQHGSDLPANGETDGNRVTFSSFS
jgi:hypothetical protein